MTIYILDIIIFLTGVLGFFVALHIHRKKKRAENEPFVCPLNFDCHTVVTSNYSRFLGVPLELWGMFYYATVAVSYASFIVVPNLKMEGFVYLVMGASLFAFLLSLYLTIVQAFRLHEWCSWCLLSALFCTIILATAFMNVFEIVSFTIKI